VRYRAILLVLLVGGLAAGAGAARAGHLDLDQFGTGRSAVDATATARGELPDPPALAAIARARDTLDRDGERRVDAFAVVAAIALLVIAAWWTSVRLQTRRRRTRLRIGARPRAPPSLPVLVVSS
jgi:hypothetical protein